MGLWSFSLSTTKTALMQSLTVAKYTIRLSPAFGATSVRSFSMYLFMSSKAISAALVYMKSFFLRHPFSILKNGRDFSALLDRNLLRAACLPFRLCTSLMVLGRLRLVNAWTFAGLALMTCFDTVCPRNCPSFIPKKHFLGFSFIFILHNLLKVSWISTSISSSSILFSIMLST
ncbi:hypothetical protein Tco_1323277 [Tanacetum coccineum]